MVTTAARQYQRRRTSAQWAAENPVLASGEVGVATQSTGSAGAKVGDGTAAWNSLDWLDGRTAFSIASSEMTTTASRISTNRLPRIVMPTTGTTSVLIGPKGFPTYWFGRGLKLGFDWVNDHTATGNVRFRFILQGVDVGGSVATPTTVYDETITMGSPGANGGLTTSLAHTASLITVTPGAFGTLYSFELQRLGDDAADTLAGSIGLAEFVFLGAP